MPKTKTISKSNFYPLLHFAIPFLGRLLLVESRPKAWSFSMEIELVVTCDCCGLKEDCTQYYISEVKAKFEGKWLCGLCSEAVRDEAKRSKKPLVGLEEAVNAHMSFCRKFKANPAVRVADGMRLMLRRRSSDTSASSSSSSSSSSSGKKYGRSASSSQMGFDMSSLSLY